MTDMDQRKPNWGVSEIAAAACHALGDRVANKSQDIAQLLTWHRCVDNRPLLVDSAIVYLAFPPVDIGPTVALVHMFRHPIHGQGITKGKWAPSFTTADWERFFIIRPSALDQEAAKTFLMTSGFLDSVESREWRHLDFGYDAAAWLKLFGKELSFVQ